MYCQPSIANLYLIFYWACLGPSNFCLACLAKVMCCWRPGVHLGPISGNIQSLASLKLILSMKKTMVLQVTNKIQFVPLWFLYVNGPCEA